jgi:hypothetical protein
MENCSCQERRNPKYLKPDPDETLKQSHLLLAMDLHSDDFGGSDLFQDLIDEPVLNHVRKLSWKSQ